MEILFKTKKLQKTFNSEQLLIRQYGKENGRLIMRRMTILDAAECLGDVPQTRPERCHALLGDRRGQYAIDVKYPFRILFQPANDPLPRRTDGSLDLSRVTSIQILDVKTEEQILNNIKLIYFKRKRGWR